MKKIITTTSALVLLICFSTISAHAGAARRHTIEGVLLGTGVALLGAAILNEIHIETRYAPNSPRQREQRHTRYERGYQNKPHKRYSRGSRGHWEIQRIWIGPVYEEKWNPGHYSPRGKWVRGKNKRFLLKDGYWHEAKRWVRH